MNKDIHIANPFGLSIEILETEEKHVPSFRCEISLRYETMYSNINYSDTDTWFEYLTFDNFLTSLRKLSMGEESIAELYDMSREIIYRVTSEEISVSVHRTKNGTSTGNIELRCDADNELIAIHRDRIENFAKWW